jgi:acyl dehydratase
VDVRTLHSRPSLGPLFARAALTQRGRGGDLRDAGLRLEGLRVDRGRLLDYQHLCRFGGGDVLPHTYPHVLGFPLQVQLMTDRSFPLPLPGLVHLENRITVHRRLTADDVLEVTVHAARLRQHAKGRVVDLVTEIAVDGQRVWEGCSTYLRRGAGDPAAPQLEPAPALPLGPPTGVLRVPEGAGRAYAAVSGDVNPIHLHALTARTMGFSRAIAHGMWTFARTLAVIGDVTAEPSTSRVWFGRPVLLPSTVEVVARRGDRDHGTVLGLRDRRDPARPHLVVRLSTPDERVPSA